MNIRFRREAIKELIKLQPMEYEEAAKFIDAAYKIENADMGEDSLDQVAEPAEFAELVYDNMLDGEYDDLMEASRVLEENGFIMEDFGIGVGAPLGADQGIPCGGDCKAVVAKRMDGGHPHCRFNLRRKKKKKAKK